MLPVLFATGLFAGMVDAIAGGGGLISLPVLLGIGVPPHLALGTNKLQGAIGTSVATYKYYREGWFSLKTICNGLIFGLLGAFLGTLASLILSSYILNKLIPLLLFGILIYSLLTPKLGATDKDPLLSEYYFFIFFGFILGFYDGFFGPGTGSLWLFSLTFFLGYNLTKATSYTKVFNLKSNIVAIICFAFYHAIDYRIALCMACGQIIGGQLGAYLAIKKGADLIRPVFLSVVAITISSLFYKNYVGELISFKFFNQFDSLYFMGIAAITIFAITLIYWQIKRKRK